MCMSKIRQLTVPVKVNYAKRRATSWNINECAITDWAATDGDSGVQAWQQHLY